MKVRRSIVDLMQPSSHLDRRRLQKLNRSGLELSVSAHEPSLHLGAFAHLMLVAYTIHLRAIPHGEPLKKLIGFDGGLR